LSAGGAEEVEASPEWLLRSSFPFSAGGAPVVCCGGSGDLFALAALRSGGARESLAGDRETAALGVVDLKGDGVREQDDGDDAPGWRLVRAEFRRLSRWQRGSSDTKASREELRWRVGGTC
jgi:hypothetical protein